MPGSAEDLRVNVGDTVHFAYNEYNIEDTDKATLQRQATWLQKYPSIRVTVEGDCDERGTREYNLALGARRANAVKEYLVSLGVSAGARRHDLLRQGTSDLHGIDGRLLGAESPRRDLDHRRRELLEQFQEKCEAVFRSEMRPNNNLERITDSMKRDPLCNASDRRGRSFGAPLFVP